MKKYISPEAKIINLISENDCAGSGIVVTSNPTTGATGMESNRRNNIEWDEDDDF